MSTATPQPSRVEVARPALTVLDRVNLLLLGVLVLGLCIALWPHWSENPDLSHGYLMPLVFLLLAREARHGTRRYLAARPLTFAASSVLLAAGVLMVCVSGVYAAAVDWSSNLVGFTLTLSGALLLGGCWVSAADRELRLIPFNWPAFTAIALWLLSAPIPPGTYTRVTIQLQLTITDGVLHALHLLGIAAARHGNVIQLANTSVGVEDACSGVRSLISCLFAGLFFSATLVRGFWPRAAIILLAGPIALAMNFARSLVLTLLANAGVDITGTWHDATGFAVLGLTAVILAGLAVLLDRLSATRKAPDASAKEFPEARTSSRWRLRWPVTVALSGTLALAAFFAANTRPSGRGGFPAPNLGAILPAESPGWQVDTSRSLYQFSDTLRTTHLAQRTYLRRSASGVDQITVYLAYWPAGQAPVSLVASHTPDACWPGAGWSLQSRAQPDDPVAIDGRGLPGVESRVFTNGVVPQHVWFWHLYDGHPIAYLDPYSASALLKTALRYGFRHGGDQLFVRVSSNRSWTEIANEPVLKEIFARLQPLGL